MNGRKVAAPAPQVIRRTLGGLSIEATAFGDGRVGVVAEGNPEALRHLATGLALAGWLVETYENDPNTLYAEGRGEQPKAVVDTEAVLQLDLADEAPITMRCPPSAEDLAAVGGGV